MKIKIKLMGMLKEKTPDGGELDLESGATIADVLTVLNIEGDSIQAFSVNGLIQRDQETKLNEDDELVVLPPVGGG